MTDFTFINHQMMGLFVEIKKKTPLNLHQLTAIIVSEYKVKLLSEWGKNQHQENKG